MMPQCWAQIWMILGVWLGYDPKMKWETGLWAWISLHVCYKYNWKIVQRFGVNLPYDYGENVLGTETLLYKKPVDPTVMKKCWKCFSASCVLPKNKPNDLQNNNLQHPLTADMLLLSQLVRILSILCSAEVSFGFVYDRARRSGEDGTSARVECEYARLVPGTHRVPV